MLKIPINSMFSRKTEEPDRDAAGIPYASRQDIQSLRSEYEQKTRDAQDPSLESCFNYCWALVHSRDGDKDVSLGLNLIRALLSQHTRSDMVSRRELLYLQAVGQYRKGDYLQARSTLQGLVESHPDFRQAETLLDYVENEIVKEGIIGIGAGAAILGVVGTIAIALASGRKR